MQIVRVFWGDLKPFLHEIPNQPLFNKEIVMVFGTENEQYFKSLGYNTYLINPSSYDLKYNTILTHYGHKLEALKKAEELYDEYLFLDWDIDIIKPIDNTFYELIKNKGNIQCPLYAYQFRFLEDSIPYHLNKGTLTDNLKIFFENHVSEMRKYHWKFKEYLVIPCFCFLYSNNNKVATELLKIMNNNNLIACIEEFAMFLYTNCPLDQYISQHEPVVIRGKEKDKHLENTTRAIQSINKYIDSKLEKNIYLIHDARP